MTARELLADVIMTVHAGYSLFVVLGLGLILCGTILRWRWIRNRRFRMLHLVATMLVVARVWMGVPCPFSFAEDGLRRQITASCPLGEGFHHVLHRLAYRGNAPDRFARSTTLFGTVVLLAFVLNGRADRSPQPAR